MDIGLPLEATGVRGIRILKELPKKKVKSVEFNDIKKEAARMIKYNLRLNKVGSKKVKVCNLEANLFLLGSKGFDFIDVDPFGSPNPFLDSAVKRLRNEGYLAVTCTDTASLSGTYPKVCMRKYWAVPRNDSNRHETGLRILTRKVQLIGAQYHKALVPVFCYSHEHYFRAYFQCFSSKSESDEVMEKHGTIGEAGPMWLGNLWDIVLIKRMKDNCDGDALKLVNIIEKEAGVEKAGFFDVHEICENHKFKVIPKMADIIGRIEAKGYKAVRTHFSPTGIRSDIDLKGFVEVVKKLGNK